MILMIIHHCLQKIENEQFNNNHCLAACHFNIRTNKDDGISEFSTRGCSRNNIFQQHGRTLLQIPRQTKSYRLRLEANKFP